MKQQFKSTISTILTLLAFSVLWVACKKEKDEQALPPVISGVTDLFNRGSMLANAEFDQWIIIKGAYLKTTHTVDFNGEIVEDSLYFADDSTITVKIPKTLPDPVNNPITVTTRYGTATYNFQILQPPPVVTGFDPVAAPEGAEITVKGDFFNGATSVKFNNVSATIVAVSKSEIKVIVPTGQTYGYITVTTPVGEATSEKVFGFRVIVYDDALATGWSNTSWSTSLNYAHTDTVKRGTNAVLAQFTSTWGAVRVSKASPAMDITGFAGVKFSIYGGELSENKKVKLSINGVTASGFTVSLRAGEWNDFQIPLTSLGNPTTLSTLTFQEFSGVKQRILLDDIGLY